MVNPIDSSNQSVNVSASAARVRDNEHKEAVITAEDAYIVRKQVEIANQFGLVFIPPSTHEDLEEFGEKVIDIKRLPGGFVKLINGIASTAVDAASAQAAIDELTLHY